MTVARLTRIAALGAVFAMLSTHAHADNSGGSKQTKPPAASTAREGAADDKSKRIEFENAVLKIIVIPRTREQMKAFYEGRGFPQAAIAAIAEACFMTVVINNKTDDILWLELDNWLFHSEAADVKRLDRGFWSQRWETLHVPMANRSTFGWTLLPEWRDLQAGEGVGGNITMAFTELPFQITAKFNRGAEKHFSPLTVQLQQLQCIK